MLRPSLFSVKVIYVDPKDPKYDEETKTHGNLKVEV